MKNRSVPKVIIFSLITFGIYMLFWVNDTRREMVQAGKDIPPLKLLIAPFLALLFVAVLQFVTRLVLANDTSVHDATTSFELGSLLISTVNTLSILTGFLVTFAFLPISLYWFYKYCKAVESLTNGQTTFGFSYGLLIVLGVTGFIFIWPGLIQDAFNKLPTVDTTNRFPSAPNTQADASA